MSRKNSRKKIRSFLDNLKNNSSCVDCGVATSEQLTFDHQLGQVKRFDLASSAKYSIGLVMQEIEKCHIVCITCHRIREEARLKDKNYQDTKARLSAVVRVFLLLAVLSGSEVAYKEYRDISREKEKKKKDRQRYKRNRARARNPESTVLLQNDLPMSNQNNCFLIPPKPQQKSSAAPSNDKLLYTLLFDEYRPDSV